MSVELGALAVKNFRLEEALLKNDGFRNLLIRETHSDRHDDQLVFNVVYSSDYGDALAAKLPERFVNTKDVDIDLVSVGRGRAWNKPVVDGIDQRWKFRMYFAQLPVDPDV